MSVKAKASPSEPVQGGVQSLHQHILETIVGHVLSGRWPVGHRIASEHELAASFGCSRMTVSKAMTHLAQQGLIERKRRAGSFVKRSQATSAVLDIPDIRTEVKSLGLPYRYEILGSRRRRRVRADAALLSPAGPVPLRELLVLHYAGATPFCLEQRLINLDVVPQAADEEFATDAPGPWLTRHVPWTTAEHRIRAGGADAVISVQLKVRRHTPCLMIERRTWSGERPVTFVMLTYAGDLHQLVARFSPAHVAPGVEFNESR